MSRGKYNARPVDADGFHFDSTAEYRRYEQLKLMLSAGVIGSVDVHPRYPLLVNGQKVCVYEADFAYQDTETGLRVVEDVKGVRTSVFILKKKLMKAILGIDVQEVKA
jgi:hypothetical protein